MRELKRRPVRIPAFALLATVAAWAQWWDPGPKLRDSLDAASDDRLRLSFEARGRYESRTGNSFGKDPDLETGLYRTRLGLTYHPVEWLKVSGMMQDARA